MASTFLLFAVSLCPISCTPRTVMMAAEKTAPASMGCITLGWKLR